MSSKQFPVKDVLHSVFITLVFIFLLAVAIYTTENICTPKPKLTIPTTDITISKTQYKLLMDTATQYQLLLVKYTALNKKVNVLLTEKKPTKRVSYREPERFSFSALKRIVYRVSIQHNLPPRLIFRLINKESSWRSYVISRGDCVGLMQIKPIPGKYTVSYLLNPNVNIRIGVEYLSSLEKQFSNYPKSIRIGLALASYNCGIANVNYALRHSPPIRNWTDFSTMVRRYLPIITRDYITQIEKPIAV